MLETSRPQRHILVQKAGLQCSPRELVKSGLVALLTSEREEQAGKGNKTFRFSLSWTLFPSLCQNTPFFLSLLISTPYSSQPYTFLSIFISLSHLYTLSLSLSLSRWLHRILRWPAQSLAEKGKQRDETHRFVCTSMLCACCGRGGNGLLLSCQRCPGKALSVHKATQTTTKVWDQDLNSHSLPITATEPHSHKKTN